MAKENSFDIVSQVDLQEVNNAVNQAVKELKNRFDFKGSKSEINYDGKQITLIGDDEFKLKNVVDILEARLVKRGINLKALRYGKIEPAARDTVRQRVDLIQGLDRDIARVITKLVKDSKLKVQASVQGDQVRISGKNRDDLQEIIKILKETDFDIPLQFVNYRTSALVTLLPSSALSCTSPAIRPQDLMCRMFFRLGLSTLRKSPSATRTFVSLSIPTTR
jgi:uncharacterized protein YajQ (UPF0234 family)